MIKVETLGMYDVAKNNPVLTSESEVVNHSFITVDGILYLIDNTIVGDDAYKENVKIAAGEYLNGYQVKAWEGQKLVVDGKHVTGGIASLSKDTILVAQEDGTLKTGVKPDSGVYFKVSDTGVTLTEAAIKVVVCVA
jgi:hypothetical protein